MNAHDLLDMIGDARSSYIMDAQQWREGKKKATVKQFRGKRIMLVAAIVALMLLLVGCVAYVLGLQDLEIGTYDVHVGWGETKPFNFISLQGYSESPNYQASKEWNDFLDAYDPDGELLKAADDGAYTAPMDYMSYLCYTPEMKAKIDEICDKYNLEILGPVYTVHSGWEVFMDLNIPSLPGVFSENNVPAGYDLYEGYYYRDGTFQFSGEITFTGEDAPWLYPIQFTYRCVQKTAFDGVLATVGELETYDQWNYTLPDGTTVLLALSTEEAFIIADTEDYFASIMIPDTYWGDLLYGEVHMTREVLEAFAGLFSFTYTPQRPDPSILVEPEWFDTNTESTAEPDKPLGTTFLSYSDYISSWLKAVTVHPEAITYALQDLNGNNTPELIVRGEETVLEIVTSVDGITSSVLGGYKEMNLCQGNIIEVVEDYGAEWRTYYKIMGREAVVEECLMYSPEGNPDNPWSWSPTGGAASFNWIAMSEDAYNTVREKYPYIQDELEWKPITEFPTVDSDVTSRLFENLFLPLAGGEYLNGRVDVEAAIQRLGYESYSSEGILYVDDPENPGCFLWGELSNRHTFEEIYELGYCLVDETEPRVVIVNFEDRAAPRFYTAPDLLSEPVEVNTLEELVEYFYHG